jgi:hypothetical protein
MSESENPRSSARPRRNPLVRENLRFAHRLVAGALPIRLVEGGAYKRKSETRAVNRALPNLLSPFPLWFAFFAWRMQAIGVLRHLCQGALEKKLDLLIRRAVLPFREFSDPGF